MTVVELTHRPFPVVRQSGDLRPTAVRSHTFVGYADDLFLLYF